jgi:hypothetical protein
MESAYCTVRPDSLYKTRTFRLQKVNVDLGTVGSEDGKWMEGAEDLVKAGIVIQHILFHQLVH